ncbi:MAG: hypothetical protein AAF752_08415 [Bacteroidota bacterium]
MHTFRLLAFVLLFAVLTLTATPADAQILRGDAGQEAPVRVYEEGRGFSLNQLFSPEHFQLRHSYEMSYGSAGGSGLAVGTYTSSLMWQFNQKLAARADIAVSHTPFGTGAFESAGLDGQAQVYLRNAEIAYRPTQNAVLHLSYRRSPYGGYLNPFGYAANPYGYGRGSSMSFEVASGSNDLFWRGTR